MRQRVDLHSPDMTICPAVWNRLTQRCMGYSGGCPSEKVLHCCEDNNEQRETRQ